MAAYIKQFAFGNAEPAALWAAFATASGATNLPTYLAGYTDQAGYPLVTVAWDPNNDGSSSGVGVLTVSQARHFTSAVSKEAALPAARDYLWWVPLSLMAAHPGAGSPVPAAAAAALASYGFTSAGEWRGK